MSCKVPRRSNIFAPKHGFTLIHNQLKKKKKRKKARTTSEVKNLTKKKFFLLARSLLNILGGYNQLLSGWLFIKVICLYLNGESCYRSLKLPTQRTLDNLTFTT